LDLASIDILRKKMNSQALHIEEYNLSVAWAKAFLKAMESGFTEITPLVITVKGLTDSVADDGTLIRNALDEALLKQGKSSCDTIANTIFPQSLWNPKRERQLLYDRYTNIQPRLKKCPANKLGIYFNRLIAFEDGDRAVNQLEHVIETWHRGNHRRSALQASIFDPRKDHKHSRQRGFPCLQQVVFAPQGKNGEDGFAIIGFYAMQHIFTKAYGNYLGLCRLGKFMANAMNLKLTQMTCIASVAQLGIQNKAVLRTLENQVRSILEKIRNSNQFG